MNTEISTTILDLDSPDTLKPFFSGIAALFSKCFSSILHKDLWEWAYIENPFGNALVSVAIVNGEIVGHYAVIPMDLSNGTENIKGFLSMTTMVDQAYRKEMLFKLLADRVYQRIIDTGLPSIVFGFPNNNSTPGFKKRLNWQIDESYKVITMPYSSLPLAIDFISNEMKSNAFMLDMENKKISEWRTKKPRQSWEYANGIGMKNFQDQIDIMHINKPTCLTGNSANIDSETETNMLLPASEQLMSQLQAKISLPYRFGYRIFNMDIEPKLIVQMSMSDVF